MSDSFVTPWAVAHQASLSMGFSKARILEWVAISPPGNLLTQGSNPHYLNIGRFILYH